MDNVKKVNIFPSIAGKYDKHYKVIEQCFDCIEKKNTQIQRIQADTTMSIIEKQRKIMKCQDIINENKAEIENTRHYLQIHNAWTSAMEAQFEKVR
jgi:hypothetical protein